MNKLIVLIILFTSNFLLSQEKNSNHISSKIGIDASYCYYFYNFGLNYEHRLFKINNNSILFLKIGASKMIEIDNKSQVDLNENLAILSFIIDKKLIDANIYFELGISKSLSDGQFSKMNKLGIYPLINLGYKINFEKSDINLFFGLLGIGTGYSFHLL